MASVNGCRLYKASKSSHNQNVYVFWLGVGDSGGAMGREREASQQQADPVSALNNGLLVILEVAWEGVGWVGSRDIWEEELTEQEE